MEKVIETMEIYKIYYKKTPQVKNIIAQSISTTKL